MNCPYGKCMTKYFLCNFIKINLCIFITGANTNPNIFENFLLTVIDQKKIVIDQKKKIIEQKKKIKERKKKIKEQKRQGIEIEVEYVEEVGDIQDLAIVGGRKPLFTV